MTDSNTERPEPDAYKYEAVAHTEKKEFRHDAISLSDPQKHIMEAINGEESSVENKEMLWSGETINDAARFEEKAREIERLARRLEAAIADIYDREELLELVNELHDQADDIAVLKEVFSGDE